MSPLTYTDVTRISFATPEEFNEASKKALNVWVGMAPPLWAPFWAAAGFGVSVWAMGQAMSRLFGGALLDRDMPLAVKWPGFLPPAPAEVVAEAARTGDSPAAEAATEAQDASAAGKADMKPLIDPVTEMPVVPAVVQAIAEPALPSPKKPRKTKA